MTNIDKLNIQTTWTIDVEFDLDSHYLLDTIREENESLLHENEKAKVIIF